jgi:hypothetical protein
MTNQKNIIMNKYTIRLGYLSARANIILTILLIGGFLMQFIIVPDRVWVDCKTSYYTIDNSHSFLSDFCGVVYFLQTPLILVLFACLHDYASGSLKIFSRISLSFIISFAVLRTLSYLAQVTIDNFNFHTGGDDCQIYYTYKLFQNFTYTAYVVSLTVFPGLAQLFIIPVFSRTNKTEKKIRLTMFFAGITNLTGALMFILDKSGILDVCMLVNLILFIMIMILFTKFFRQFKSQKVDFVN